MSTTPIPWAAAGAPLLVALALLAVTIGAENEARPRSQAGSPAEPSTAPPPHRSAEPDLGSLAVVAIELPPPPAAEEKDATPDSPASSRAPAPPAPRGGGVDDPHAPVPAAPVVVTAGAVDRPAGETILRRLEAGDGAGITLAWPASPSDRRRVTAFLTRCAGLSVALMAEGRLWRLRDPAGRPWTPDPSAVSPVMRRADGLATPGASVLAARLRAYHRVSGGALVALVARRFDARLLGGLARLAWARGRMPDEVQATYHLDRGQVLLTDVRMAGVGVPGSVVIGGLARCD